MGRGGKTLLSQSSVLTKWTGSATRYFDVFGSFGGPEVCLYVSKFPECMLGYLIQFFSNKE